MTRCVPEHISTGENSGTHLRELGENIKHLKEVMKAAFDRNSEIGFYTLRFHLLALSTFGNLETLDHHHLRDMGRTSNVYKVAHLSVGVLRPY